MTRTWTMLLALAALALAGPSAEGRQVFRSVDAEGNVSYSDHPQAEPGPSPAAPDRAPVTPPSAEAARSGPATLDELLALSGLKAQLPGIVGWMAQEYRLAHGTLGAEDQVAATRVIAEGFEPEKADAVLRERLGAIEQATLDAVAAWYRSPLGLRISGLEVETSSGAHASEIQAFAKALETTSTPQARSELIERLDWVTGSTHVSTAIMMVAARSLMRAGHETLPPERRLRPGQQDAQLRLIEARAAEPIRALNQATLLYTYRPLSDDELIAYVRFHESPAARAYSAQVKQALIEALTVVADDTARALVRAVPPERWTPASAGAAPAAR